MAASLPELGWPQRKSRSVHFKQEGVCIMCVLQVPNMIWNPNLDKHFGLVVLIVV
jgi:hypothetical protein